MRKYNLAIIGFGNVGQGLVQILADHADEYRREYEVDFQVVAVRDTRYGSVYEPNGLPPADLLEAVQSGNGLESVEASYYGWENLDIIRNSNADIIVELTYTDLLTGQPAIYHIEEAFKAGKHVVTSNKGPVALRLTELKKLAKQNNVCFGIEGTVMSGTPTIKLGLNMLLGSGIEKVQGILNGTTNFILVEMAKGSSYEAALAEAQRLGYAEADPTGDVEGFDAAGKVVILSNLLLGMPITMNDVDRQGITHLKESDILEAQSAGEIWKLVGCIERKNGHVEAFVKPQRLPMSHPLANVNGATNAMMISTEILGDVTVIGPGAGRLQTGFAIISDLLDIHRETKGQPVLV